MKYNGRDARDAFILYCFLLAFVNHDKENENKGWAWPSFQQIVKGTGIQRNRIKKLLDILISENLIISKKITHKKHLKSFYKPIG